MVGIVAVSHSRALADAAVSLALEMVAQDPPQIAVAAGTPDGGFGTDAVRVAEAISEVSDGSGVVVITDLGSAVLSAEMALEFLPDPDVAVRIVPAPFVEGLLAAVVRAAGGADLAEVAAEAAAALDGKVAQLGDPVDAAEAETAGSPAAADSVAPVDAETREVRIVNAAGLHARPAGKFAAAAAKFDARVTVALPGKRAVAATSALGLAGLGTRAGDTVELSAVGPAATAALAELAALIESGFGEAKATIPAAVVTHTGPVPTITAASRHALGVSAGRVVGPVLRMPDPLPAPDATATVPAADREGAVTRLNAAIAEVVAALRAQAVETTGQSAEVLEATAGLAGDAMLSDTAAAAIRDRGLTPEAAAWETLEALAAEFLAVGGLQAERVTDLRDIKNRIVAALTGAQLPGVPESKHPYVLVAHDLAPADTARLRPEMVLAIVSAEGGPTAHTAILARSLGIPAVVAAPIARELRDGDTVLVDGATGEVVPHPDEALSATASRVPTAFVRTPPFVGPGATANGTPIGILANVGGPKDVPTAVERGADGVGLFRTEFCFLSRTEPPSREEQVAAYQSVLEGFRGGHVVLRTLDAGSDKPLPFLTPGHEDNPALGVRGFRTAKPHPEVLAEQLAAIADAAAAVPETEAWVMAPMISTVPEAAAFARAARDAGLTHVGVMVETPAAALMSAELFEHIDFVSLGTNDLAQYTMAADRLSGSLAEFGDPWQPAVLRLIELCVAGAGGKPVGVCGEAAADPLLARVLVGLGVTSLSMTPRALPIVGAAVASSPLDQCADAAAAALAAPTAVDARAAAARVLAL